MLIIFNIKKTKNDFEFEIIGNKINDLWVEKNKIYIIIFPKFFNNKTKNIKK